MTDKTGLVVVFTALVLISLFVVFYVDENDKVDTYDWIALRSSKYKSLSKEALNGTDLKVKVATTGPTQPLAIVEPTSLLGCEIRKMDPWDPQILYYNDPNWKPSCKQNRTQITQFVDGRIVLNNTNLPEGYFCRGRCLLNAKTKADWEHVKGTWENITTFKATCDVVEVACGLDLNHTDYNFLHTQIYERPDDTHYWLHSENLTEVPGRKTTNHHERPNVYLLVFDSTSTSEFVRSMSRTLYLMKEQHQAVIFQHMNKVGINSRPNSWTLMFGKQIYELGKNPYTDEIFPDLNHTMNCNTANDNENYWMHRFRDLGYHTMMAEDWASGAINWPNCWGFMKAPAKHYMKPFQRRNEEKGGEQIRKTITDMCHETFEDTSLYLDQFMSAYRNESQLAYIWNTELAHNYVNGLYHADDHFYRILKSQEERLNNSFVFIMGDHGMRFGGIRNTEVGELEDNNPFLMVSVPVRFRESKLMTVLRQNAQKLMTHYDTYASFHHLHELAKNNKMDELLDPTYDVYKAGHTGSSYFRGRMKEPRDCGTLRIPFEYCICKKNFEKQLEPQTELAMSLGDFAVDYFQGLIDAENQTTLCQNMSVVYEKTVAERLIIQDAREIYKLKVTVMPSEGFFDGFVEVHRKEKDVTRITMMSKSVSPVVQTASLNGGTMWWNDKTGLLILFYVLVLTTLFVVFYVDEEDKVDTYNWAALRIAKYKSLDFNETDLKVKASPEPTQPSVQDVIVEPTSLLGCELERMDPWHPQILPYDNPAWKPGCKQNQTQLTVFVDGKIVLNGTKLPAGHSCHGRCLLTSQVKADWEHVKGPWENITTFKATCDVVEVACGLDLNHTDYNFLHTQIYERPDDTHYWLHSENLTEVPGRKTTNHHERPNVYLLVFDSTSTSEFVRSMSRTLYLMKEQHQAVIFKYMNKVGINSRPNAWSLAFGKQIYELGKNPYTDEIFPDLNHTMNCRTANDDENYWMHRFRDLGYHTMMADDWASSALNWPNCWGFMKAPAKHYMKPFQKRNEEKGGEQIRKTIKDMCHETFEDTSLYLDQFMSAYRNESQLAYIWNTELAHNYVNGLYHADDHFYRTLKRHEDRLNNSFVFIMGDHGMRFGGIRRTDVGELEDNTPVLMVSVPVRFRESKLMTLAKNNKMDELLDPAYEVYKAGHTGSSYFRRRMKEPRDCGTLRIPFEYCICKKNFEKQLEPQTELAMSLGDFAADHFQEMIEAENQTHLCQNMSIVYNKTIAERLILHDTREIYKLKVTMLPSEGVFEGYVEVHRKEKEVSNITMMSKRFARLTNYGTQGDCVVKFEELRPVCYCVEQKKT
ncbi:hypothetical protein QR680_006473 [Steinernema hermaphroditum]|uniref:Uncharacterized protein n=1 Tax=Steinernema hermaphroditum TaxID=289476 RepID=A0AA39LX75_9BILA|nr:hypothetical protein QR680_006473 [Steinernema hermaphroditum]